GPGKRLSYASRSPQTDDDFDHTRCGRSRAACRPHCRDARGSHPRTRRAAAALDSRFARLCAGADGDAAAAGRARRCADRGSRMMAASLDPRIADALALLPNYLGQHVILSISAVALGIALGLPLAMVSLSAPRWRFVLLSVVGLVQTIPSLALLALFYPLL